MRKCVQTADTSTNSGAYSTTYTGANTRTDA